ncbi:cohesin domain-containing protein [Paenibacillus guangzhouensis]|uniref:cohesin domain-containing protein n=1 Tax=Paenibacillus guangzhouensis TaxID=1473112 RepID=UPI0012677641|nr:cohesin domain-containing protein [Paenibacillus guangzhouensis]
MKLRGWKNCSLAVLLMAALGLSLFMPPRADAAAEQGSPLSKIKFGTPENMGYPIRTVSINDGVMGKEDGKNVLYTTASTTPAVFNVIDVKNNQLIRDFELEGVAQSWRHVIAPDQTVYIGAITSSGTGELWSYSPVTKKVQKLKVLGSEKSVWSMTTDPDGNVYIGTYDHGKLFRYNPKTQELKDYGSLLADHNYIRSMAYHDGYIYAGMALPFEVVKVNVATGASEVISDAVPGILGVPHEDLEFAYDMAVVDKYLFVKASGKAGLIMVYFNLETQQWENKSIGIDPVSGRGVMSYNQIPVADGKAYVPAHGGILEVDLGTLQTRNTGISFATSLRGAAWIDMGDPELTPDRTIVTIQANGKLSALDVKKGIRKDMPGVAAKGGPLPIHNMEKGTDGRLYMSAYPGGVGGVFDPRTKQSSNFLIGQAEGIVSVGNKVYYGIYPGGYIYEVDISGGKMSEPKQLFQIGSDQDRPYKMAYADGKLIIGTIPDYGQLGGAITIYDLVSGEKQVYRNLIKDHSIIGLAYKDGKIYGSTTKSGGLNTTMPESNPEVFVFDMATTEMTMHKELTGLAGLGKHRMISGLTFGKDGLLWGGVDGILFALNPNDLSIAKQKNIYPDVKDYGMWRPYYFRWGEDGLLYAGLANRMTVVDPDTLEYRSLTPSNFEMSFMTLAKDAEGQEQIYYTDGTKLMMIPISASTSVKLPVRNGCFEEPLKPDNSIPGWSNAYTTTVTEFSLSSEQSYCGDPGQSLKVVDQAQGSAGTGSYLSDPIPVVRGAEYTAAAKLYIEQGLIEGSRTDDSGIILYFYDKSGKQISTVAGTVIKGMPQKQWVDISASGVAPEQAAYARIALYSSAWNMMIGYYDQVTFEGQSPGSLKLKVDGQVAVGESFKVTLQAQDVTDLAAVQASLAFDPALFEVVDVQMASSFGSDSNAYLGWNQDQTHGKVNIIATLLGARALGGSVDVAQITLKAKQFGDPAEIVLTKESLFADKNADLTKLSYTLPADVKLGVQFAYDVEDVNQDHQVNAQDVTLVAQQLGKSLEEGNRMMDLNGDGKIDISDLSLVVLKTLEQK